MKSLVPRLKAGRPARGAGGGIGVRTKFTSCDTETTELHAIYMLPGTDYYE